MVTHGFFRDGTGEFRVEITDGMIVVDLPGCAPSHIEIARCSEDEVPEWTHTDDRIIIFAEVI